MTDLRPTSGLYDHTGYWLRRLSNLVHTAFEQALAEHGVTVAQWSAMVAIHHGDASTPNEIAQFIAIDRGAVTRLADRLAAKGLLRRGISPHDRRSVPLELTDAGRALVERLAALADQNDARFFASLGQKQHRKLKALLSMALAAQGINTPSAWRER